MGLFSSPMRPGATGYKHGALFYAGEDEFVLRVANFIQAGVRAQEPQLVVVSARKIDRLRRKLGRDASHVVFADMKDVGGNPARIIPAWQEFVKAHAGNGQALRGVGEPIFPERSPDELIECEGHEALLNASFDTTVPFWLLCPYDTVALPAVVLAEAQRNHPMLQEGKRERTSSMYRGRQVEVVPFTAPLSDPPDDATVLRFNADNLDLARGVVSRGAAHAGFRPAALAGFVFAVNEVATNSLHHGGGGGVLRLWNDGSRMVCEVRDGGQFRDRPLVGRERPADDPTTARGLWLANQLCDLVQLRSFPDGAVVRLHKRDDAGERLRV